MQLTPQLPVQRPILHSLWHIIHADLFQTTQIRQRAGDFEDAVMDA